MNSAATLLQQGLEQTGLALDDGAQKKLLAYIGLLEKWNKTYSLTAVRGAQKAVPYHVLDSLAILPLVPVETAHHLLDVGSGGGMPGIPLAIVAPHLRVVLLDSNSKKTAFLQQAAIELGLKNISIHCGRVEHYAPPELFSVIVSRAFAELADFVSLSQHLLKQDGRWLAMKGVFPTDEIARLPAHVQLEAVQRLQVPGVEGQRHAVLMQKIQALNHKTAIKQP